MLESAGTGVVQSMLDQNILINVPYLLSEERLFLVTYTCKYYVNRWPWGNFPWYRGLRDSVVNCVLNIIIIYSW